MILLDSECVYEGRGLNRMIDTYQFDESYTFEDIEDRIHKMYPESMLGYDPIEIEKRPAQGVQIVTILRYERVPDYIERRTKARLHKAS